MERLALTSVEAGVGLTLVDIRPDDVLFRVPLNTGVVGPDGRVHPVLLSAVADTTVGIAVFARVAGARGGVTVELRLDHVGVVRPGATHLEVTAWTLGFGPEMGTGRAELRDDRGGLVAHAVGVMILDSAGRAADERGGLAAPSAFDLADVQVVPCGDGVARAEIGPAMMNRRGGVHGGVLMGLAYEAQELSRLGMRVPSQPVRLSLDFLRPASAGGHLLLRSAFTRRGRRVWTIRTEIVDANGKTVAIASGTSAVGDAGGGNTT